MKIVHTSDWHIGRRWKGIQRLDELEAVLGHLAGFIERESIDLVLHTGDVFESRNPPAEAEQLVNRFLVRVGRTGAQMLVVAGNHDDPLRLDARSLLTESVNVQIVGRPRSAFWGGTRTIETRSVSHVPYEGGLPLADLRATLDDETAVREAFLDDATAARLREQVYRHVQESHAAGERIATLSAELGEERVSDEQLAAVEKLAATVTTEVETALGKEKTLAEQTERMKQRLERSRQLREQLEAEEAALAKDLRSQFPQNLRMQSGDLDERFRRPYLAQIQKTGAVFPETAQFKSGQPR